MSYKSTLQTHNAQMQENNALLAQAIEKANALPDAGGGSGDGVLRALVQRTITEFSDPTLEEIGSYAFYYCTELASVNLPAVKTINSYAFGGCSILSSVKFPLANGVPSNCFRGCQSLETADFGKATRFETNAFYNCSKLTALIIRTPTVAYLSSAGTVFTGTPIENGTGYIYVHRNLIDGRDGPATYAAATNWSAYQFRAIEDYPEITGG